ncbi:MAG: hypothetical protein U5K54_12870 [Cytophagales bacterium]|nr:hypothetical protein [Cytophagales bacterium]
MNYLKDTLKKFLFDIGRSTQPFNLDILLIQRIRTLLYSIAIKTQKLALEARYARDEVFLQDDNERISMGTNKWPIFTLKYTHGFSGVFGSDFEL